MKRLIITLFTATLSLSTYSIHAATVDKSGKEISDPHISDQPEAAEQTAKKKMEEACKKDMLDKKAMQDCMKDKPKKMDMQKKHTKHMDEMKELDKNKSKASDMTYENSLNNEPIGTTTDNPKVNTRDATNGNEY